MKNAIFSALAGFYVLRPDGQLGYYDQDGVFVLDTKYSAVFADYNRRFLRAYLEHPAEPGFRLGIVYQPALKRVWGSETLALETPLLKSLYPTNDLRTEDLTEFQKKNREKSIYRAMEIFLEYRNDNFPDVGVYAPILFDRGTTLHQYPTILDRDLQPVDKLVPVMEVINLIAGIPLPKRNTTQIHLFVKTLHQCVIRKNLRKTNSFALIDKVDSRNAFTRTFDNIDIDARATYPITLAGASPDGIAGRQTAPPGEAQAFDGNVERTGKRVKPELLQGFSQFRYLDDDKLMLLARTSPVYRAPGGAQLLKRGAVDPWNFYLLQGKLVLEAADGAKQIIEGGTQKAGSPISFLKPRKYTVTALTPVSFLWIHDALLDAIVNGNLAMRKAVGETA